MARVFLLEDIDGFALECEETLRELGGEGLTLERARSVSEAERMLDTHEPGHFDLLLFDLVVPRAGAQPNYDGPYEGLEVAEHAWQRGYRSGLFVLSQVADKQEVRDLVDAAGRKGRFTVKDVLDKSEDFLLDPEGVGARFEPYLMDLTGLQEHLRERLGFVATHHLLRSLLFEVVDRMQCAHRRPSRGGLEVVFFRGDTGSGKSWWIEVASEVKRYLAAQVLGKRPEDRFHFINLGDFLDTWTENDRARLFGAKGWSGGEAGNSDGSLILATAYEDQKHPITELKPAELRSLRPDRLRSDVCRLDEVLSCPPPVHSALYEVIDKGVVPIVGITEAKHVQVGCVLALATNLETNRNHVDEGKADRRGQAERAFWKRLATPLRVPNLEDLGFPTALETLRTRAGKEVAPIAEDALREVFGAGELTMRDIRDIALKAPGRRITLQDVRRVCPAPERIVTPGADLQPPGLPVTNRELEDGRALWTKLKRSGGAELRGEDEAGQKRSLTRGPRCLETSPGAVLALIIVAYASYQAGRLPEREVNTYLATTIKGDLRKQLRNLSGKYPSKFRGTGAPGKSGTPVVTISDVKRWAEAYERMTSSPGDQG